MAHNNDTRWHVEPLQNGLTRVYDRSSGLAGLFNPDGTHYAGDLRRVPTTTITVEDHPDKTYTVWP